MKKSIYLFSAFLLLTSLAFSQATIKPSLGFSFNNFSETPSGDFNVTSKPEH